MPPKQRQIRMEQRGAMAAIEALQTKSDEELEREQKFRAPALAILGARAAEKYDAVAARSYFQRAIAAARPQERMQIRRMADASLALAERRPDDLKTAVERLGQQAPTGRQLLMLRLIGLVAPPKSAGTVARVRGILIGIVIVIAILAVAFGLASLLVLPFGGANTGIRIFVAILVLAIAIGALVVVGRRRQRKMQAAGPGGPRSG
jgi:hypothetical protein